MSTEAANSRYGDARAICLFYGVAFVLNWLLACHSGSAGKDCTPSGTLAVTAHDADSRNRRRGGLGSSAAFDSSNHSGNRSGHRSMAKVSSILALWVVWDNRPSPRRAVCRGVAGYVHTGPTEFFRVAPTLAAAAWLRVVLEKVSFQTLLLIQFAQLLIAPGINAVFAFGEEWGWRGFLLSKLLPLGQWRALIFSGALWGLWHMPVILLGYNYPLHPKFGVLLMMIFCVIMGILFGWMRLATGSIWPAVIGHGALNAAGGFGFVFANADQMIDTAHVTILGWTGWILPVLTICLLVVLKMPASVRAALDWAQQCRCSDACPRRPEPGSRRKRRTFPTQFGDLLRYIAG